MSTLDPHARLERSYRRMLWLFPPSYRLARGRELLDVLMDRADPGQHRPSRGEALALLRFSVRTWSSRAISPSPAATRDAMGIQAVLLPLILLFPAAAALHMWSFTGAFQLDTLPFGADIPAWLLWCLTAVLLVFGRSSWPRYTAVAGTVAYLAATIAQYLNNNFLVVGNSVGLLAIQVVAAFTLVSPERVERGRKRIPVWAATVLGLITAALGFSRATGDYRPPLIDSSVLLPVVAGLAVVFGVASLFTAAGRAMLPIITALGGLILVAKYRAETHPWANGQPAETGDWSHISLADVLLLIAAPVAVFIVVRTVTATVDRFTRSDAQSHNPIQQ